MSSRGVVVAVVLLTAAVLSVNVSSQIYDSNFVFLWEATSILAGDRPYRDFFEWGAPLSAYLSAAMQWIVGYRLIGEFLLQWTFIVFGVTLAVNLALRLSRSAVATMLVLPVVLLMLCGTATYHYSKLFVFPMTVLLAWRYLEDPRSARSAALGALIAVAFLLRHDYVVYTAAAAALAMLFGIATSRTPASVARLLSSIAVCGGTALALVVPWALAVERGEGLLAYTQLRANKYEVPMSYTTLWRGNPFRELLPDPPPTPRSGVVAFRWQGHTSAAQRADFEQRLGLRELSPDTETGRVRYSAPNLFDVRLLELDPFISDGAGFKWDRLHDITARVPSSTNAILWLAQVSVFVPLALLISAAIDGGRAWRRSAAVPMHVYQLTLAAIYLLIVNLALLRELSYTATTAPLTAGVSTWFIASRTRVRDSIGTNIAWQMVRRGLAIIILLLSTYAAAVWVRQAPIFAPRHLRDAMRSAYAQLIASPPAAAEDSYLRECTPPGNHLFVTGSTPFDTVYFAERPVAAGHLYWHSNWGAGTVYETKSLMLLQQQSVPFAISNRDPVLDDLKAYPKIRAYIERYYIEVQGTHGRILRDTRRTSVRSWGDGALPCFR